MDTHHTRSGLPLRPWYGPDDAPEQAAAPGEAPFTRGITAAGYRDAPWIMGQYAGFGSAEETNRRYRDLLAAGGTGFSVALDLPTQMGYDSDHPLAIGEVGKVGVAIDSLADVEVLFGNIPLEEIRQIRTTANSIGHVWLALIVALCEKRDADPAAIKILIQNDVLKEYVARGTYILPPPVGLRIVADVIAYCARKLPGWTPLTLSGYHMREAGADAVQELAFTFANGIEYCRAAARRGLHVDEFAPSLFSFLSSGTDIVEEVAKFRAARTVWAEVMEGLGARVADSKALRIFAFTAGSNLTAQQPYTNVIRVTLEALAAVLGGVQTLHTSAYDEALGTPTTESVGLALRTQQVILEESGLRSIADPLGGAYAVEALTGALAARVRALLADVASRGGALACIETGWFQQEIAEAAYRDQLAVERGERHVVGVNVHGAAGGVSPQAFRVDPASEAGQIERLRSVRAARDAAAVHAALADLKDAAAGGDEIVVPTIAAVRAYTTVGEICDTLRAVHGVYRPAAYV